MRTPMFSTETKTTKASSVASTKIEYKIEKGRLKELRDREKLAVVVRQILADMSDRSEDRQRYHIAGDEFLVLEEPKRTGTGGSYRGRGRCWVGVHHPEGHVSKKYVEFDVTFRDIEDEYGQPFVQYQNPSNMHEIPRSSPVYPRG